MPNIQINDALVDRNLSPRLNQILVPLLSIVDAEEQRNEIRETVKTLEAVLYGERASTLEASILEILVRGFSEPDRQTIRIGDIATSLISQ